jgi:hypothetical protein
MLHGGRDVLQSDAWVEYMVEQAVSQIKKRNEMK